MKKLPFKIIPKTAITGFHDMPTGKKHDQCGVADVIRLK